MCYHHIQSRKGNYPWKTVVQTEGEEWLGYSGFIQQKSPNEYVNIVGLVSI
jgi:hypothetical protein